MRLFTLLLLLSPVSAFAMPAHVLLLRHGEKPADGNGLSDRGWQRAHALPQLFARDPFEGLGTPAVLFAQKPKDSGKENRPFQTLQFVAEGFHQSINTNFERDDVAGLVHEIKENPAYRGKLVVVCWEHKVLDDIAAALGVNPEPEYPGDRFDRAWLLTYGLDPAAPHFEDLPEHLLPGDTEK